MTTTADMSIIYVTAGSMDEARRIASALVEERLAACANILGEMESVYRWKGKIEHDREIALIVKTRSALVVDAIARIEALHGYETPCAVALPIAAGAAGYLAWLDEETAPA